MVRTARINPLQPPLLGWMQSLGDAARLRLLRLIERQELGGAELCDILQMPQSTVSRHLKMLTDQGWTACRRNGTANLYRMTLDELAPPARKLWLLARKQIDQTPATKQDQLRLTRRLRQRQSETQSFFATTAGQWDKLRNDLYGTSFSIATAHALLPADWTVADLGCGTGLVAVELAPYVKRVIGVDQSQAMLKTARKRAAEHDNVELRCGDLEALPLDDGEANAAVLSIVLTYVDDPVTVLTESARVVRPGGRIVVIDLLRHERDDFRRQMGQRRPGFETDELESMLADAGFKGLQCRPLPPDRGAKGPALVLAAATR